MSMRVERSNADQVCVFWLLLLAQLYLTCLEAVLHLLLEARCIQHAARLMFGGICTCGALVGHVAESVGRSELIEPCLQLEKVLS